MHTPGFIGLLPLLLLGCDAQTLGVSLPQGGEDAIHASFLRRSMWTLTDPRIGGRPPGSSGAQRVAMEVAKGFEKAHLAPGFGESYRHDLGAEQGEMVCGVRPGGGAGAIAVLALDPGIGALSAVPIVGLLGLVKAFDGPEERDQTYVFCVLPEAGGLDGYVADAPHPVSHTARLYILGSLTGTELQETPGATVAGIQSTVLHTGPLSRDLGDEMGKVDFEGLTSQVRAAYSVVTTVR